MDRWVSEIVSQLSEVGLHLYHLRRMSQSQDFLFPPLFLVAASHAEFQEEADTELPMPIHMPSDRQAQNSFQFQFQFCCSFSRYLDGLDEETRAAVIKKYIPDEPFGGGALRSQMRARNPG